MTSAIYPLSADPITYGHIDFIERAAKKYDKLVVGIGINPQKKYLFTLKERTALAKKALGHIKNVFVIPYSGLLISLAKKYKITTIIRGYRDAKDKAYEQKLSQEWKKCCPKGSCILLKSKRKNMHIRSSVVKKMHTSGEDITGYAPLCVKSALDAKSGKYLLGVTGEIASGKSYLSKELKKRLHAHLIELDLIGHEVLEYPPLKKKIIKKFGKEIIVKGKIGHKALGDKAFADLNSLKKLDAIVHGPMIAVLKKRIPQTGITIITAALLAELNLMNLCNNNIILIKAPLSIKDQRLSKRDITLSEIKTVRKVQLSHTGKKKKIIHQIHQDNQGNLWEIQSPLQKKDVDTLCKQLVKCMKP